MERYIRNMNKNGDIALAAIHLDDAEAYLRWVQKDSYGSFDTKRKMQEGTAIQTVEDAREVLNDYAVSNLFAILEKRGTYYDFAGIIGPEKTLQSNQRSNIKLLLDPDLDLEKSQYIGRNAIYMMLEYCYNFLNLNSILFEVPAYNTQNFEVANSFLFDYAGKRTHAACDGEGHLHDVHYFQINRKLWNQFQQYKLGNIAFGCEEINPSLPIPIPADVTELSPHLEGNQLLLQKYQEEEKHIPTMINYLNSESAIPLGEYKTICNPYRSTKKLKGVDYLIMRDQMLLGYITRFRADSYNKTSEVAILIGDKKQQGKGYGQEALHLFVKELQRAGYYNIDAHIFDFNTPSLHLFQKEGFSKYMRQDQCYFANGRFNDMLCCEKVNNSAKQKVLK